MTQQTYIYIKGMRVKAYHGCLEQERTVGNDYVINLQVGYPWQDAAEVDDLTQTLSYATLADIIKQEMAVPANLIETVAQRTARRIMLLADGVQSVDLEITKIAPPMSCDCQGAGVKIHIEP